MAILAPVHFSLSVTLVSVLSQTNGGTFEIFFLSALWPVEGIQSTPQSLQHQILYLLYHKGISLKHFFYHYAFFIATLPLLELFRVPSWPRQLWERVRDYFNFLTLTSDFSYLIYFLLVISAINA